MIYGKVPLENLHAACIAGEEPASVFESGNLRLFFFGVLYNRDVLRAAPEETDAKVASDAFLRDSVSGFSCLDGSFTIVYYAENECGVVRDHHGTHYSIYYTADGSFSSSWQYLKERQEADGGGHLCYNPVSLSIFLQSGILAKHNSVMEGIFSLPAGGKLSFRREEKEAVNRLSSGMAYFHSTKVMVDKYPDIDAYSKRYGELHRQAVKRRVANSRRVGILLSGGYDSGSNLAALRSIYDGQIESYSIGFKGDAWSELPMARLMSETFGTSHHEYEIDGTEIKALPDIVRFLGEPFAEGGLMVNYCAMRMIGDDKPEVILGGDGSDQYFGTSGREVALHYLAARAGLRPFMYGMNRLLERPAFDNGGKLSRVRFHLDKILHLLEGERFGFSDSALRIFLQHPDEVFFPMPSPEADTRSFEHLYTQHAQVSDQDIVIDRIILFKASRMARMFSNNLVYPFMDLELYRFLEELPVGLKCKGDGLLAIARGHSISKFLLKHCYKPLLPAAITARKKQGGFVPMPLFFRDDAQRARLKEFILSSAIFDDYLRRDTVEKFLTAYDREAGQEAKWFWYRQNRALQYFHLLTLVIWWEEFVEKKEVVL